MEARMDIVINFMRPGKGVTRYTEDLVDDNRIRIKTATQVSADFSRSWCEENWWRNGFIPPGMLISSVVKYLFYREWFSVMQLVGTDADHLGFYVDIDTPLRKVSGEFYLTDLFLDLWIAPNGTYTELDWDEFEASFLSGLITPYQYRKANRVIEILKSEVINGDFYQRLS
jgi:hypothetical protein